MTGIAEPEGWQKLVQFVEAPRGSYSEIRKARTLCSEDEGKELLRLFVENAKATNMIRHTQYINAIKLNK